MAGITPTYGLRYAELVDPPDGAALGKNLADDVEAELTRIDAAHAAHLATPALLHQITWTGSSAAAGDFVWGDSGNLDVAGRNVRVTVSGSFSPAVAASGILAEFQRSTDGGVSWTRLPGSAGYFYVASQQFSTAFMATFLDLNAPAGNVRYQIRTAAHYANGAVLEAGTQFTVEDAGPA